MPQEYSIAERERAADLYVEVGLTLEQVSERTGIPIQTIKRWSSAENWPKERDDSKSIKEKHRLLRKRLLDAALETLDPQCVYAVTRIERIIAEAKRRVVEEGNGANEHVDRPRLFLEILEFIAEALKEFDPEGLKVFARNFDLLVDLYKSRIEQGAA